VTRILYGQKTRTSVSGTGLWRSCRLHVHIGGKGGVVLATPWYGGREADGQRWTVNDEERWKYFPTLWGRHYRWGEGKSLLP